MSINQFNNSIILKSKKLKIKMSSNKQSTSKLIQKALNKLKLNMCTKCSNISLNETYIPIQENPIQIQVIRHTYKEQEFISPIKPIANETINETTINISKFPFLIASPEQTRCNLDDYSLINTSGVLIQQSNQSINDQSDFSQQFVESFGFQTADFKTADSKLFSASIVSIESKPEILSAQPMFV